MDLVQCIGFDKAKLTADQVSKLTAFIESQPAGDLLALKVYSNLDTTRLVFPLHAFVLF